MIRPGHVARCSPGLYFAHGFTRFPRPLKGTAPSLTFCGERTTASRWSRDNPEEIESAVDPGKFVDFSFPSRSRTWSMMRPFEADERRSFPWTCRMAGAPERGEDDAYGPPANVPVTEFTTVPVPTLRRRAPETTLIAGPWFERDRACTGGPIGAHSAPPENSLVGSSRRRSNHMSSGIRNSESTQVQTLTGPQSDEGLFARYQKHATAWDELFARSGQPHEQCAPLVERLGELATCGVPAAPRQRRPGLHQPGDHVLGLFRPPRGREDLPLRPDPPAGLLGRVEGAGSRIAPAGSVP